MVPESERVALVTWVCPGRVEINETRAYHWLGDQECIILYSKDCYYSDENQTACGCYIASYYMDEIINRAYGASTEGLRFYTVGINDLVFLGSKDHNGLTEGA